MGQALNDVAPANVRIILVQSGCHTELVGHARTSPSIPRVNQTGFLGFGPDEMLIDQPTRSARLRWVIVVSSEIGAGSAANAIACVAATVGDSVAGIVGPAGTDASGGMHPGLPWPGCTILAADAREIATVRAKARGREGLLVVDMPAAAQTTRVYADYLAELATTDEDDLSPYAVGIVGPRNQVDRVVGKLPLYR